MRQAAGSPGVEGKVQELAAPLHRTIKIDKQIATRDQIEARKGWIADNIVNGKRPPYRAAGLQRDMSWFFGHV